MKKMIKPTAKVTTTNISSLYKLLIVCFLAVLLAACDDDNKPATYSVTFDTDGGTPELAFQTVKSGERAQEPTVKPTKADSVAIGWINTANNQAYDFSSPVRADLTLKASYTIKTYKVRFETNGGNRIEDLEVSHGETIAVPMPPTKTGVLFAGWYADNMFTDPYSFNALVTADIELYAKWSDYNIPDEKFRAYLKGKIPNAFNGEQLQIDHREVKELKTINIFHQGIVSLKGIQYFTGLTELFCNDNRLNTLDVSNNTALTRLECNNNPLTSLDVSNNTALETLACYSNRLTSLDVSNNTALETLACYSNRLTSLDVSNNTALETLACYSNRLTSLDVSNNAALKALLCYSNKLSSLDVSSNTALIRLSCFSNELSSLNLSTNTGLKELYCYSNELSSLNLSTNTDLILLACNENQLSSLNVSNNKDLTRLDCSSNKLSLLDVLGVKALKELYCYSNELKSLNLSTNTDLKKLYCSSNQLSSLDVSNNTALTTLACIDNQLSSLNIKANRALTALNVSPNNKLENILVHKSKLCDTGIINGSGVKGIFKANKGSLEMTITSYDYNGDEVTYDEAAYEAACP